MSWFTQQWAVYTPTISDVIITGDAPSALRSSGPLGAASPDLAITDAPTGLRCGGADGVQGSGIVVGPDTPSAARYGGPDGGPAVDLAVSDGPRGTRYGGPSGVAAVGLTLVGDSPSATRGGGPDGSVFADVGGGVTVTDTPGGSRYYGPDGALAIGVVFGPDTPSAGRNSGPDGGVAADVVLADAPSAARVGGPAGVVVVLVGATDTPSALRNAGPVGALAIVIPLTGDTPSPARHGGASGVLIVGIGADTDVGPDTPGAIRGGGPSGDVLLAFLPTRIPYVSPAPLAIPAYSVWLADTVTGRMLWELPLVSHTWSITLGQVGTASVTLDIEKTWDSLSDQDERDPRVLLREVITGPWRFCIVIMWGNNVVWAGPYISLTQPQPNQVQLNCAEILKLYSKRVMVAPGAPNATDTTANTVIGPATTKPHAMAVLLTQALTGTGNSLPITIPDPGGAGTDYRTYYGYDLRKYSDAIASLSAEYDGPELRLDPQITAGTDANYLNWVAQIGNPHIGRTVTPWVWDDDVSAMITLDADASNQAMGWWSGGSGSSTDKVIDHLTDTHLLAVGYPMLEEVDTNNSSQTLWAVLDAITAADLAANKDPILAYQVSVRADTDPMVGTYKVGEDYILDVRDNPVIPDGTYTRRIAGLQGTEKPWVTITDAPPLPVGSS